MRVSAVIDGTTARCGLVLNPKIVVMEVTQKQADRCPNIKTIDYPNSPVLIERTRRERFYYHRDGACEGAPECGRKRAPVQPQKKEEQPQANDLDDCCYGGEKKESSG